MKPAYLHFCDPSDLPQKIGEMNVIRHNDVSILLAKTQSGLIAFNRLCPHGQLPLDIEGKIINNNIKCTKHDYEWSLINGGSNNCSKKLLIYEVHTSELGVFIEIPVED